jgi:hypothetical protein
MSASTVYDIRLRYMLEDKASKGLAGMNRNMAKTAKSSGFLAKGFARMAGAAGAAFGVRAAAKSLIGFNASMEQSKIQIQGMLTLGGKMDTAMANSKATKLFKDLQTHAKASVGTTKDMVDMAALIARPVMAAGLGMKDLGDFTAQAVVASKAFGIQSDMAARDIESAMMGQLRSVDRFSRNLLEPLGFVGEEGRKVFNELGAAARAAKLKEALASPAIAEMAKQQAASFDGVLSTFQDGLQMALGTVGKPLFAALTEEIKSWSVWMEKNKHTLDKMGKSIGSGLVKGFKVVKGVVGFMVDHASTLLLVAKAWAAIKLGSMASNMMGGLGNMVGAGGGGMAGMFNKLGLGKAGTMVAGFGSKLAAAAGPIGMFVGGIGLMVTGIHAFNDWMNAEREADLKKKAGEKAEALGQVSGIDAVGAGMKSGMFGNMAWDLKDVEMDQDERRVKMAEARNSRHGKGMSEADIRSFAPMDSGDIKTAQALTEGLPARKQFYKEVAGLVTGRGLLNEYGLINSPGSDENEEIGKRYFGVADGTGGHAGNAAGTVINDGLTQFNEELKRLPEVSDRLAAVEKMLLLTYVEGPTARAQEELDALKGAGDGPTAGKAKINVTINRIEVASDDPDRFVFQLSETVKKLSRAPAQAAGTQKLGGG